MYPYMENDFNWVKTYAARNREQWYMDKCLPYGSQQLKKILETILYSQNSDSISWDKADNEFVVVVVLVVAVVWKVFLF